MNITSGVKVTTIDPRTGKKATGTVKWVSPTRKTCTVVLADGFIAYEFPVTKSVIDLAIGEG